jgi:hypothetical protein
MLHLQTKAQQTIRNIEKCKEILKTFRFIAIFGPDRYRYVVQIINDPSTNMHKPHSYPVFIYLLRFNDNVLI